MAANRIDQATTHPVKFECGVYRHYKGQLYLLLGIGQHTVTGEIEAVYVSLEGAHLPGPRLRIRPLSEFEEKFSFEGDVVP